MYAKLSQKGLKSICAHHTSPILPLTSCIWGFYTVMVYSEFSTVGIECLGPVVSQSMLHVNE